jgi:hypothetical protein
MTRMMNHIRRDVPVIIHPGSVFYLLGMVLLGSCERYGSDPAVPNFECDQGDVLDQPAVSMRWGELTAVLVKNEAFGADHRAGYSGLTVLRRGGGKSPFVPLYAGLNLETWKRSGVWLHLSGF